MHASIFTIILLLLHSRTKDVAICILIFNSDDRLFFSFQPRAPVVTRACYLLECAYYVHQCNRGQWPSWLKMNLPSGGSRPSRGTSLIHTQPLATRRSISMQLQASKMFHQWGEVRFSLFPCWFFFILPRCSLKSSRKYKD